MAPQLVAPPRIRLKQRLRAHGVTYDQVAREAGVSWLMVYAVLSGRRVSAPVLAAARRLLERTPSGAGPMAGRRLIRRQRARL